MNTQAILTNPNLTKTEKIRQLLALGLTRRQVTDLTGGNYGFVQNVFAKYWPEQVRSRQNQAPQGFAFVAFNRRFGIEIEAYNVEKHTLASALREAGIDVAVEGYNHTTRAHWKIVTDGSLNGNNTFELVSPILEGQDGLNQLQTVCRVLKQKNAYINRSCGLHVHFDAEHIGLSHTKNLLINYSRFERVIDSFMPISRRAGNNGYCLSFASQLSRIESASTMNALCGVMHTRYYKVNLQAYLRHKTIEFRQHSGTIEFEKISNWVLFLHNLVEYSRNQRVENATFESLRSFQQDGVITYLNNRISELAA
ncbi:amidoligase enzyme [Fibrisoma montanum]|uniref:Amidoligase enzyme n=1 Tax=Fibrisoma montanum TaxID=2305895 RepID=A0A418M3V7_9BACT|nr:amidoligase family protein [Fibrisoma montanum]RIV20506.1 amidoligase enzyme [Fibrisoma montanum]